MSVLLRVCDLHKSFGRPVLRGLDFELGEGEIVTLMGPNGSGKSTLLQIILGLLPADGGTVERAPGLRIGYMPQRLHTTHAMPLSASRFIAMGGGAGAPLMEQLDIERIAQVPLHSLSSGELQRVLLARALAGDPQLLLLDEPAQGVDLSGLERLYNLISGWQERNGCTVLMVSHDLHMVMATTHRVLCLNGHICCQGVPQSITGDPDFIEMFGEGVAFYRHIHDHRHHLDGRIAGDAP